LHVEQARAPSSAIDARRCSAVVDFFICRRGVRRVFIVYRYISRWALAVSVDDLRTLADTKANQIIERHGRRAALHAQACVEGYSE